MEYLMSFICIAVIGSIVAAIVPSGSSGKAVKMIASFILAFSVISIIVEVSGTIDWEGLDIRDPETSENEAELARQTTIGLSLALEQQVRTLVKEYCGKEVQNVKCGIEYEDSEFRVTLIKLYMEKTEKAPLFLYLSQKLNLDYSTFELYEMS